LTFLSLLAVEAVETGLVAVAVVAVIEPTHLSALHPERPTPSQSAVVVV
jgi:uncharacterized coiled-coil protein SlyX